MAFDNAAAHVIVLIALVTSGGSLLLSVLDAGDALTDEGREKWREILEKRDSAVELQAVSHDAETAVATLVVKNTGIVRLDPAAATLVLDGVPRTATHSVEGIASSRVWLRGENATFVVTGLAQPPGHALLSLENGRNAVFSIAPQLTTITITPANVDVVAGTTQAFTAEGFDQFGAPFPAAFAWTTTAGSIDAAGLLTATHTAATGREVVASGNGVAGHAGVNVVADSLASLVVVPADGWTVLTSGSLAFSASGYDQYGNPVATTPAWTTTIGSIDAAGLLDAPSTTGCGTITATQSGMSGTSDGCVRRAVHTEFLETLRGSTQTNSFNRNNQVTLKVTVEDHLGALAADVTVAVSVYDSAGETPPAVHTMTATTDASGVATFASFRPSDLSSNTGSWTLRVTALSGTLTDHNSASDQGNPHTITVT